MLTRLLNIKKERYIESLLDKGMKIGEGVYLNDGFFLDRSHANLITLEDKVVFGPGVTILAHDASTKKVIGKTLLGKVTIKRNAFVGANSTVLPGVTIGENAIIGANSTVTKDVPENEVWAGNPAKMITDVESYKKKLEKIPEEHFVD